MGIELPPEYHVCHPTVEDAQAVNDFLNAVDIAEYGEPDSELEDLKQVWEDRDLSQDAWLVYGPGNEIVGYGIVLNQDERVRIDFYALPGVANGAVSRFLVSVCCQRMQQEMAAQGLSVRRVTAIVSHVNEYDRNALQDAGFEPKKFYFNMEIQLDVSPRFPTWPGGYTLRTMKPGLDDQTVYQFVRTAFDWPGREHPFLPFDQWRDFMMRPDHFEPDLWFLLFHDETLVGAALCFDYEAYGWVRQLAVAASRRRQGLGSALLQHVFTEFYRRERRRLGLVVDSTNPKANAFYENVGMSLFRQYDEYHQTLRLGRGGAAC